MDLVRLVEWGTGTGLAVSWGAGSWALGLAGELCAWPRLCLMPLNLAAAGCRIQLDLAGPLTGMVALGHQHKLGGIGWVEGGCRLNVGLARGALACGGSLVLRVAVTG